MADDTATADPEIEEGDEPIDAELVHNPFEGDEELPAVYERPIALDEQIFQERALDIDVTNMSGYEWHRIGSALQVMEERSQFWLGDWWLAGENKWGADVYQLFREAEIDFAEKTAKNYSRVCDTIPPADRVPELNFGVHREAASLSGIRNIRRGLKYAAEGRDYIDAATGEVIVQGNGVQWTVAQMKAYVKSRQVPAPELEAGEGSDVTSVSIALSWNFHTEDEEAAIEVLTAVKEYAKEALGDKGIMARSANGPSSSVNES